jgi:competence protein ComEC
LALWVVVAFDPWALLQPGFWLSFVAVGVLMISDPSQHAELAVFEDPDSETVRKNSLKSMGLHWMAKAFQTLKALLREQ